MDWSKIKHFTKAGRHFLFPDLTESSRFELISNNGQTIVLFADKHTVVASDYGSEKYFLQYDLRPGISYILKDNALWLHPRGKFKIIGYYPNYFVESTGQRVYIGPKLNFYFEPQLPIDKLANNGDLLVDQRRAKLCQRCEGLIPVIAGPNAKYCCYECGLRTAEDKFKYAQERAAYRALRKQLADATKAPPRLCLTCDKPLDFSVVAPRAKYCSHECGLRSRGEARDELKSARCCKTCKGPIDFANLGGRAKYCSEECGLRPAR